MNRDGETICLPPVCWGDAMGHGRNDPDPCDRAYLLAMMRRQVNRPCIGGSRGLGSGPVGEGSAQPGCRVRLVYLPPCVPSLDFFDTPDTRTADLTSLNTDNFHFVGDETAQVPLA